MEFAQVRAAEACPLRVCTIGKEKGQMNSTKIKLTITHGYPKRHEYLFEDHHRCVIGRAEDCDLQLPKDELHADVSRHHCLLEFELPQIRLRDLGSRNGTYVNGEKIGQRLADDPICDADLGDFEVYELHNGDEIRMGHTVLRVDVVANADQPEPCPMFFV
jgi:eukaryotic-like serine/threonine-protein kinase